MPAIDQSPAKLMQGQSVRSSAPSNLKVWNNATFEDHSDEDDTRATVAQQQQRSAWANTNNSLRTSMPAEARQSEAGSSSSWASPRPYSPRLHGTERSERVSQPGTHRLSQAGSFLPSPSSRVSAAGSDLYPLGQLFTHNSGSVSPTGNTWTRVEGMASPDNSEEVSRTRRLSELTVPVWHSRVKELLASQLRQEAVSITAPDTGLVRCYIRRSKGGLLGGLGMHCTYRMFLEDSDLELMSAVKSKQLKLECPTYTLFHEGDVVKGKKEAGIAKLAPNETGSQYHLRGTSRSKSTSHENGADMEPLQLCISFEEECSRSELRSMHCLVPVEQQFLPDRHSISQAKGKMVMLCTRQPDYDEKTGFTLPVEDRYFMTSIKNFQLVRWHLDKATRGSQTLLQFGKLDKDLFALDFAAPLSIKTAFAIALAATEAKYLNSNA